MKTVRLILAASLILPLSLLGAVYKSRVNAQWSTDNTHFWYRNDLSGRSREFVLVNLGKGTRKAAFDHGQVAKALREAGAGRVESDRLPIDQLGFDLVKGLAFFRVKGSHFQLELKTHKLRKLKKKLKKKERRKKRKKHRDMKDKKNRKGDKRKKK